MSRHEYRWSIRVLKPVDRYYGLLHPTGIKKLHPLQNIFDRYNHIVSHPMHGGKKNEIHSFIIQAGTLTDTNNEQHWNKQTLLCPLKIAWFYVCAYVMHKSRKVSRNKSKNSLMPWTELMGMIVTVWAKEILMINLLYTWCRRISKLQADGGLEAKDDSCTDDVSKSAAGKSVGGGEASGVASLKTRVPVHELEASKSLPIGWWCETKPSGE